MLNRFSKDTAVLDDLLPLTVFDFIQVCRIKVVTFPLLQICDISAVHLAKEIIWIFFNLCINIAAYPVCQLSCLISAYFPPCVLTSTLYANHSYYPGSEIFLPCRLLQDKYPCFCPDSSVSHKGHALVSFCYHGSSWLFF